MHVFDEMDGEERQKITFPKLKSLKLASLSCLISFYGGSASIEFPLLEIIFIDECGKLKSLSSSIGDSGALTDHHDDSFHVFFNQKVIFHNLMEIHIRECDGIRILFSSSTAVNLVKLQKLKIYKCKKMVKVIEDNDDVLCEKRRILFPTLKELSFFDLPKLLIFCNWRCELELPSLELVDIKLCSWLEFFTMKSVLFRSLKKINLSGCNDNIKSLFSSSIAESLVSLNELLIGNCKEKLKVIEDDEDILYERPHQLFPCLKRLKFYNMPKLQSFGNGRCEFELPSLESIEISNCPLFLEFFTTKSVGFPILKKIDICDYNNIGSLFLSSVAKNLVNLNELRIINCAEMIKVIEDDEDMLCENPPPLFPCLKLLYFENLPKLQIFGKGRFDELPLLESIKLEYCPLLEVFTTESVGFHNLKEIMISGCNSNQSLFLSSVAKTLVNLKQLEIEDCTEMIKVIEDDDDISYEKPLLLFPSLTKLTFCELPKLESFCNWRFDLQFPSLEEVEFKMCHFLEFFIVKCVTFDRLTKITISKCNDIVSLFSSSIAESLVNLKKLDIWDCKEMIKVIENADEMLCQKPLLLFPYLEELWLVDLPKLESFCNWKCDLQLSSLEKVVIGDCPLLAFFTMGNVTTANLKQIYIGGKDKSLGDLNTLTKRHFNAERQEDIDGKSNSETKGVEAHNEKIETQVEETIEENDEM